MDKYYYNHYLEMVRHRAKKEHNPKFITLSDKIASRLFVEKSIGEEYLVPIYSCGYGHPTEKDVAVIKGPYVAKANNGCNVIRISEKAPSDKDKTELRKTMSHWVNSPVFDRGRQWAYSQINPGWIVEHLQTLKGETPWVWRVFAFNGVGKFIQLYEYNENPETRSPSVRAVTNYMPDGSIVEAQWGSPKKRPNGNREANMNTLKQLIELSYPLSYDIDHVRVDFMETDNGMLFSELTFYPMGGRVGVYPESVNKMLGDFWKEARK